MQKAGVSLTCGNPSGAWRRGMTVIYRDLITSQARTRQVITDVTAALAQGGTAWASSADRTYAGRYLLVVTIAEGKEAFVVTARDMTDAGKKTFRRKAR
jgi:hypothetical protein